MGTRVQQQRTRLAEQALQIDLATCRGRILTMERLYESGAAAPDGYRLSHIYRGGPASLFPGRDIAVYQPKDAR